MRCREGTRWFLARVRVEGCGSGSGFRLRGKGDYRGMGEGVGRIVEWGMAEWGGDSARVRIGIPRVCVMRAQGIPGALFDMRVRVDACAYACAERGGACARPARGGVRDSWCAGVVSRQDTWRCPAVGFLGKGGNIRGEWGRNPSLPRAPAQYKERETRDFVWIPSIFRLVFGRESRFSASCQQCVDNPGHDGIPAVRSLSWESLVMYVKKRVLRGFPDRLVQVCGRVRESTI